MKIYDITINEYEGRFVLEKEPDENYQIKTYDGRGDYIEEYSRNIVKFTTHPTEEEFIDFYYGSIVPGKF